MLYEFFIFLLLDFLWFFWFLSNCFGFFRILPDSFTFSLILSYFMGFFRIFPYLSDPPEIWPDSLVISRIDSFQILSILWIFGVFRVLYVPCVGLSLILTVSKSRCPILLDSFKFFRILSYSLRFSHILLIIFGFFRILANGLQFFRNSFGSLDVWCFLSYLRSLYWIFSHCFGFYQIVSDSLELFQILSDAFTFS